MSRLVAAALGVLGGTFVVAAAAGGGFLAYRRSEGTKRAVAEAVKGGGTFRARLTGYWPYSAKESEKKMEGGKTDRKGKPIHTLEQHRADPAAHPYVSVSGDDAIFPYGQRVNIDAWTDAVFRVVDTGGRFRGANKLYRVFGEEPLDIAVESSKTPVPKSAVVEIVSRDNFEQGKSVATSGFKGQTVAVGGDRRDKSASPWRVLALQGRRRTAASRKTTMEVVSCAA